jgi:hypothetical protein
MALACSAAAGALFSGCASEGGSGGSSRLPTALSARWTPPAFAQRVIETDRTRQEVLDACLAAANSLGYAVVNFDGATGKIAAARRQTAAFDGARQDSLDIKVTALDGGAAQVALVLRETVESGSGDERSGGIVSAGIVRERAPYDAFFARLAEALRSPAS